MVHDVNPGCEEKYKNLKEKIEVLQDNYASDHDELIGLKNKYDTVKVMSTETRDNIEKIKENLTEIATKEDLNNIKEKEIERIKVQVSDIVAIQNSTVNKLVEITKHLDNKSVFKGDLVKNVISAIIIAVIFFILSQAFSNLFKKDVDLNDTVKIEKKELKQETKTHGPSKEIFESPSDNR